MSRHTRQECTLPLFQIEILDFSKKNGHVHNFGVDNVGTIAWQFGNKICTRPEKVKQADRVSQAPRRTLCKRFKNDKAALRWANRIGSVLSCKKVDVSCYLNNIEHLNLHQEPIEVVIDKQEFVLEKDFVITRSGLTVGEIEA